MSNPKILGFFILIIVCNSSKSCNITEECPTNNNVIWASNGTDCHTLRNQCLLDNVNCNHQNNNETKLEVITKDECQRLCINKCPEEDEPVCGYDSDNAKQQTFKNKCEMEAHICKTAEAFFVYSVGPCETSDAKDEEQEEEPSK